MVVNAIKAYRLHPPEWCHELYLRLLDPRLFATKVYGLYLVGWQPEPHLGMIVPWLGWLLRAVPEFGEQDLKTATQGSDACLLKPFCPPRPLERQPLKFLKCLQESLKNCLNNYQLAFFSQC